MRRASVARLLLAAAISLSACRGSKAGGKSKAHEAPAPPAGPTLHASRAPTPPTVDGHLIEPDWRVTPHSEPFADRATGRRSPYTEVRALWDAHALYLGFYAADRDLVASDRVSVTLSGDGVRRLELGIDPTGKLYSKPLPLPAGVTGAGDADGTVGDSSDDDEEWTIELAIPWAALGVAGPRPLAIEASRLDHPEPDQAATMVWRGRLLPDQPERGTR